MSAPAATADPVLSARDGRSARLTLNRPPLNVLDLATLEALDRALADLAGDPDLQVVVVAAAGDRAFSAGVAVQDHTPDRVEAMLATFHGALARLRALPAVSVAAVRGLCLGGGLELAASCDLVVAADDASLGHPEVDLGCFPPLAAALYPSLIGPRATLELLATGRRLTAEQAQALGLVSERVAAGDLERRVAELVETLTGKSAVALRLIKRAVAAGSALLFVDAFAESERLYTEELCTTADMAEGLAAFEAKRRPKFTGR